MEDRRRGELLEAMDPATVCPWVDQGQMPDRADRRARATPAGACCLCACPRPVSMLPAPGSSSLQPPHSPFFAALAQRCAGSTRLTVGSMLPYHLYVCRHALHAARASPACTSRCCLRLDTGQVLPISAVELSRGRNGPTPRAVLPSRTSSNDLSADCNPGNMPDLSM